MMAGRRRCELSSGPPLLLLLLLLTAFMSPASAVLHRENEALLHADFGGTMQQRTIAYVISKDDVRWAHASAVLTRCGFVPYRALPFAPAVAVAALAELGMAAPVGVVIRYMSLLLTTEHLAQAIASNPDIPEDGYALVFEDDAALNEAVMPEDVPRLVDVAARSAGPVGFFSLGMCGPRCSSVARATYLGVLYARCHGICAHAYGLRKATAARFWPEFVQPRVIPYCKKRDAVGQQCDASYVASPDARLHAAFAEFGLYPWLVGANLTDHEGGWLTTDVGTGLFYQANSKFPSRMWSEPVEGVIDDEPVRLVAAEPSGS